MRRSQLLPSHILGGNLGKPLIGISYAPQSWTKDVAISSALPTIVGFAVPGTGAYTSSDLPTGISLNADTGALTGTPTVEAYSQTFHVTATDTLSVAHVATVSYTTALAPSISYAGSPFTWLNNGDPISTASVTSSGGQVAAYTIFSGSLPTGLALNASTGAITGTPTVNGASSFVVRGTGPSGLTSDATVNYTVTALAAPSISYAGSPFDWDYLVDIGTNSPTNSGGAAASYAVQAGTLPAGVSLNSSTGALTGTPSLAAGYASASVTIRATNAAGTSDAAVTIAVYSPMQLSPTWGIDAEGTLWQDSGRTTPVAADSDPVGSWDDASGAGHHGVQATSGNRPLWIQSAINGRPAVLFDGSNDTLLTSAWQAFPSKRGCIIILARRTDGDYGELLSTVGHGGTEWEMVASNQAALKPFSYYDGATYRRMESSADVTTWAMLLVNRTGDVVMASRRNAIANGNFDLVDNQPSSDAMNIGSEGGGLVLTGYIAQAWHFPATLSGPQITRLEAHFVARYGSVVLD